MISGINPIKRQNVGEQVFAQLKRQLLDGVWKPGDRLPGENDLAAAMGVSRVSIRGAIHRLTALGLIETRTGEGSFVREITPGTAMSGIIPALYLGENSLGEVLEYRRIIEGPMAGLACEKASDEDIVGLEEIYRRMELTRDDPAEFSRADFDFHRELGSITKNTLITETYRILEDLLRVAMEEIVSYRGNTQGLYYHGRLLSALRERNVEAAIAIMTEHIDDTYASINTNKELRRER